MGQSLVTVCPGYLHGGEEKNWGLVDHYYYSVAFGERWVDGYRHLSTSVSSSSSNSSEVWILSTTLHYTTLTHQR